MKLRSSLLSQLLFTIGVSGYCLAYATDEPVILVPPEQATEIAPAVVPMVALGTEAGRALLDYTTAVDYAPLAANWVGQLKSHCGAASAVVVQNALLDGADYTQDTLFIPETAHIITQEVVYRIGFTLEELTNMIHVRSGLKTTRFHAGEGEDEHGYDAWIAALKKNRESPEDQLIVNYAVNWLYRRENSGGHFSPIADYNEAENMVLVLEINSSRPSYWVDARELWNAMNKVDSVCGLVRGWIVVEKGEDEPETETEDGSR